jgi:hypothetical protein
MGHTLKSRLEMSAIRQKLTLPTDALWVRAPFMVGKKKARREGKSNRALGSIIRAME